MDKTVRLRLRAGAAGGAAGAAGGAAGAEGGAAGAAGTAGTAGTEGSAAPKVAEPNALPEFPSPVIAYKVQVNEGVLEAVAASTVTLWPLPTSAGKLNTRSTLYEH